MAFHPWYSNTRVHTTLAVHTVPEMMVPWFLARCGSKTALFKVTEHGTTVIKKATFLLSVIYLVVGHMYRGTMVGKLVHPTRVTTANPSTSNAASSSSNDLTMVTSMPSKHNLKRCKNPLTKFCHNLVCRIPRGKSLRETEESNSLPR